MVALEAQAIGPSRIKQKKALTSVLLSVIFNN
jgi:hypothetical protein